MSALIREALELALELAQEKASRFHDEMRGYFSSEHEDRDADVELIRRALDEANVVPEPTGCDYCPQETPYGPATCGKCTETLLADAKLQQALDVIDAARARRHEREQAERAGTRRCTDRED